MVVKSKIVIVGGSFGGINAAYALRRELRQDAESERNDENSDSSKLQKTFHCSSLPTAASSFFEFRRCRKLMNCPIDVANEMSGLRSGA